MTTTHPLARNIDADYHAAPASFTAYWKHLQQTHINEAGSFPAYAHGAMSGDHPDWRESLETMSRICKLQQAEALKGATR